MCFTCYNIRSRESDINKEDTKQNTRNTTCYGGTMLGDKINEVRKTSVVDAVTRINRLKTGLAISQ